MKEIADQFKDSSTVYRDKEGKRIDIYKDLETKKKELEEKNEQRIKEWSSGLVQKSEKAQRKKYVMGLADDDFMRSFRR